MRSSLQISILWSSHECDLKNLEPLKFKCRWVSVHASACVDCLLSLCICIRIAPPQCLPLLPIDHTGPVSSWYYVILFSLYFGQYLSVLCVRSNLKIKSSDVSYIVLSIDRVSHIVFAVFGPGLRFL